MRTVNVPVYTFDELAPKMQKKVLDEHRNAETEFEWWDGVYEQWYEKLKEHGFTSCKIWFSGFYSQGDGACFECSDFDIEKLIAEQKYNPIEAEIIRLCVESVRIINLSSHYSHHNTKRFEVDQREIGDIQYLLDTEDLLLVNLDNLEYGEELKPLYELLIKYPSLKRLNPDELISDFRSRVEELRVNLCKEIYADLEKEYEYLTSDEAVKEYLAANEVEFLQNGDVWHESLTANVV